MSAAKGCRRAQRAQRWGEEAALGDEFRAAADTFRAAARVDLRARAQRASDGLVIAAYLSVAPDGRLVQAHLPGIAPEAPEKRGECDGFSKSSERRLLALLHTIRRDAELPVMVTLTFPEEIKVSSSEAKACRRAFARRCRRKHPNWCALWRIEAHPEMSARLGRMHPHFHLLTWGAFYDFQWVSETWADVIWEVLDLDKGMSDVKEKCRRAGTNCERVRKWAGVAYCAKSYIAKEEEYPIGKAGRIWGWDWRANIPLADVIRVPLTVAQAARVRVEIERWMDEQRIVSEHLICTFFDDDPSAFAERLMGQRFVRRRLRPNL